MTDVLVVAELIDGGLRKTTLSAISAARTIAQGTGGAFDVLAIGAGAKKAASEPRVAQAAKNYGVVVTTASTYGKDLLPRLAGKLNAGVASDISKVAVE